jgi:hypothetical protein
VYSSIENSSFCFHIYLCGIYYFLYSFQDITITFIWNWIFIIE